MDDIPIYTAADGGTCGVNLDLKTTYLLQGKNIDFIRIYTKQYSPFWSNVIVTDFIYHIAKQESLQEEETFHLLAIDHNST